MPYYIDQAAMRLVREKKAANYYEACAMLGRRKKRRHRQESKSTPVTSRPRDPDVRYWWQDKDDEENA